MMAFSQGSGNVGPGGPASSAAGNSLVNNGAGVRNGVGGPRKHLVKHDDQEEGKLFVGGLSWETNQESLLRYFSRFGEVIDCVVMKNAETGRSRGFGFVTFSDPLNIDSVIQSCPHNLDGRTIDPKPCNPRSMQKPKKNVNWPKVFLGGLPSSITETDLRNYFNRYGRVTEVVIMYDQEKKKARGFGFLSFESDAAVDAAVSEHYVNIQNKQVEIKRAEPRNTGVEDGVNGPVVDQWGDPPAPASSNGLSHVSAQSHSYSGWGAPPAPPAPPAPAAAAPSVSMNYSGPGHWAASQHSPAQHSWAPPHQNSYHFTPAPPNPHNYWGSPPGPTPPPSTPGQEMYSAGTPAHTAPPHSPSQAHFTAPAHPSFTLQQPAHAHHTPQSNYSRLYQPVTKAPLHQNPQHHYSSPTSPDYYSPQCAPLPSYPPSNTNLEHQRIASSHQNGGPYVQTISQVAFSISKFNLTRYISIKGSLTSFESGKSLGLSSTERI